jgi:hypothetical protein
MKIVEKIINLSSIIFSYSIINLHSTIYNQMTLFKGIIAGAIIISVTEIGPKYPRIGALFSATVIVTGSRACL